MRVCQCLGHGSATVARSGQRLQRSMCPVFTVVREPQNPIGPNENLSCSAGPLNGCNCKALANVLASSQPFGPLWHPRWRWRSEWVSSFLTATASHRVPLHFNCGVLDQTYISYSLVSRGCNTPLSYSIFAVNGNLFSPLLWSLSSRPMLNRHTSGC